MLDYTVQFLFNVLRVKILPFSGGIIYKAFHFRFGGRLIVYPQLLEYQANNSRNTNITHPLKNILRRHVNNTCYKRLRMID